jgi:hypothetical protein
MSFNRRGPDRRPDRQDRDRFDRQPRREGGGDRPPYQQRGGGDRPYPPRDRPPGDRPPYQQRGGGGDRPFSPRPRFDRPPDEGGMSIRLDPRRVNALKHLAGEAGVRPGDLVRQWVEERIDAARVGAAGAPLDERLAAIDRRLAALEAASGVAQPETESTPGTPEPSPDEPSATTEPRPSEQDAAGPDVRTRPSSTRVSAAPSERVALHDEMIALIRERGPMTAGELAEAITERGRYAPPRSGKAIDAAMVSQRVSNPTYRSRFTRSDGRIGLAE